MGKRNFNTYTESESAAFWRELCLKEGCLRHYERDDCFFREGEVARYMGLIRSGTLKYTAYSRDGRESVLGLVFAGELVADFPFSIHGVKARTSVVATAPCDIVCIPVSPLAERLVSDRIMMTAMYEATEAVFSTVYDRYKDLYTKSPQERYDDLVNSHPDLFELFSLRDIAAFLNITPTHLSRLRKNI